MIDDALNHFGDFVVVIGSNAIEVGHALHSSVFPQENKSASMFGSFSDQHSWPKQAIPEIPTTPT